MCLSVPSIVMSLLVGPWTDTGGRKPGLASPVIGAFIEALNAIIVMYTNWPIYMLFIGSVVNGCCGFFTIMTQTAMAYIADTTPETKVALRMAIMQLMILIGGLVSQITSGLWITRFGFIPPYWFILACQFSAAMYVIFIVPESKPKTRKDRIPFFSLRSLKVIWSVYRDPRHGYRRSLVLLLIGDGIVSLSTMGLSGVILLYVLRTPLCWSANVLGGFMAFRFLTQGLGGVIGIGLLKRCCSDQNIARIGLTSVIVSLVLFAFANKTSMVFLVPLVGCLNGAVSPVMKGMMSKITRPDERGATFSAVAAISTLCNFVGAFFFNPIYIQSLSFGFPGLVFLISAVLALFPLISMSFIRNTEYFPAPTSSEAETSAIDEGKMIELNENNIEEASDDIVAKSPDELEVKKPIQDSDSTSISTSTKL
ncbi:proton-coupled folate transporter-like isoform X2 [Actinia tenebrosa]|nr:proton-coupled folate transporter-like isoform X2 [Actinia tenebrosa]